MNSLSAQGISKCWKWQFFLFVTQCIWTFTGNTIHIRVLLFHYIYWQNSSGTQRKPLLGESSCWALWKPRLKASCSFKQSSSTNPDSSPSRAASSVESNFGGGHIIKKMYTSLKYLEICRIITFLRFDSLLQMQEKLWLQINKEFFNFSAKDQELCRF